MTESKHESLGRPVTHSESQLRETFIAKDLAHLRHVPTPPGIKTINDVEDHKIEYAGDTSKHLWRQQDSD
jgi:hypothetical protein